MGGPSGSRKVANFIIKFYDAAMNPRIKISLIKGRGTTPINLTKYCYDSKFHNIVEIMGRINTVINLSSNKDRQELANLKKKQTEVIDLNTKAENQIEKIKNRISTLQENTFNNQDSTSQIELELNAQIKQLIMLIQENKVKIEKLNKLITDLDTKIKDSQGGRKSLNSQQYAAACKHMNKHENTEKVIRMLEEHFYPVNSLSN